MTDIIEKNFVISYQNLIPVLEPIIRDAGSILMKHFRGVLQRMHKEDGSFATEADIASEQLLIKRLQFVVPGAGFYAEESGIQEGNEYSWVIDPLDGTTNFVQGLPHFCISVALTKHNEPVVGIVFQPLLNEFFYAIKGEGTFLNGTRLVLSQETVCTDMVLIATTHIKRPGYAQKVKQIEGAGYASRALGAAALDLAYCAAGRSAAVFLQGGFWWDIAAGVLLIEQAGGIISQEQGEAIAPSSRVILGGLPKAHKKISRLIWE